LVRDPVTQVWSAEDRIEGTASAAAYFGTAVALSQDGNVLAVGAPATTVGAANDGAIMIYTRSAGVWTLDQTLNGGNAAHSYAGEGFGSSVALSGNAQVLAAGAPNANATSQGKVYVYNGGPENFAEALVNDTDALFGKASTDVGRSVALSGDGNILAFGTPGIAGAAVSTSGGIMVAVTANQDWGTVAGGSTFIAQSASGPTGSRMGYSIAMSQDGTVIAAGGPSGPRGVGNCVNVYSLPTKASNLPVNSPSGFNPIQTLYPYGATGAQNPAFGVSVALSPDGNVLAVGAPSEYDTPAGTVECGATWVFTRNGQAFSQPYRRLQSLGARTTGNNTGAAVALSSSLTNCTLIVGVPGATGAAFAYV